MSERYPRRFLAVLIVAALVALLPGMLPAGAAVTPPAPVPVTPVLSARRLPGVLQGAVADPKLAATLDPYLDKAAGGQCAAVLDHGRVAYSRHLDATMAPASVQKLLTATVALQVLGPDATLTTVTGAAAPMVDGVVDGDLYLVGGGDPLLTTAGYKASLVDPSQVVEDFAALADSLVAAGLKQVKGGIVGDDSRHERVRWVPSWPTRYQTGGDVGPLSALMVNDGQTGFAATPDRPSTTRKAGDPPVLAAQTLKSLLVARGVTVSGDGSAGAAPAGMQPIAHMDSLPISQILGEMLSDSDNTTAELLTRELGLKGKGQGTTAAGVQVIQETLASMGYATNGLALKDGSGFDPTNHVPCSIVLDLLRRTGRDSIIGHAMAVAGKTGTLRLRMLGTDAVGRLQAKTGTLNEVNALAGFADTPPGNTITFVMIQNGLQPNQLSWVDHYAALLMTYAQAPTVDALGPLPATP